MYPSESSAGGNCTGGRNAGRGAGPDGGVTGGAPDTGGADTPPPPSDTGGDAEVTAGGDAAAGVHVPPPAGCECAVTAPPGTSTIGYESADPYP